MRVIPVVISTTVLSCGTTAKQSTFDAAVAPGAAPAACFDVKSFGATGDGKTDDTLAIQAALDATAKAAASLCISDGVYMVKAVDDAGKPRGVSVGSNTTLQMSAGATLRAIPNGAPGYSVLGIRDQTNVTINGGTVEGDRDAHTGTKGEWGFGVAIYGSSNVTVVGVTARNCWGDGFYVGTGSKRSAQITFKAIIADNNRRQGLSIVDGSGVTVQDSTFTNTHGTPPAYGIDLEPNAGASVQNVSITNCKFDNNYAGVGVSGGTSNTISKNVATNNNYGFVLAFPGSQNNTISGNTANQNTWGGLLLQNGASNNMIRENTFTQSPRYGIWITGASDNSFVNNRVSQNSQFKDDYLANITVTLKSSRNHFEGNTLERGSGPNRPSYGFSIITPDCEANEIVHNDLRAAGVKGAILDKGTGTVVSGNMM
jgi:parallel beta-helix repeat protein